MPENKTIERAMKEAREGKAPSTQAGEFVREEVEHAREGKRGARSLKQAVAIGLSKARRGGVKLPPTPGKKRAPARTRRKSQRDTAAGQSRGRKSSRKRSSVSATKRGGRGRKRRSAR
jgi:hypothetical protein